MPYMTQKCLESLATAIAGIPDTNERIRTAVRIGRVCQVRSIRFDWRKWDRLCRVDFNIGGTNNA